MPSEPRWLTAETAIVFNRAHDGLLESACARPRNMWAYAGEEDVVVLASALGLGIALNHPFEQGNKRTGLACAIDFLETNGFVLPAEQDDSLGRTFEAVIAHVLPEGAFVEHLRRLVEAGMS